MLLSLRSGNILCMSHSYAVRTEEQDMLSSFISVAVAVNPEIKRSNKFYSILKLPFFQITHYEC